MGMFVVAITLSAVIGTAVPLTESQRVQVESATDFDHRFDEGALYPLLYNAVEWEAGDEAGAVVPDYVAIFEEPAEYRGQLFLIEGAFAGRAKKIGNLTRPGPWGDKLYEWVIVTNRVKDEVVVAYLVDPPAAPATGSQVRLVARFYKVLADTDQNRKPTDYLLFVGHGAEIVSDAGEGSAGSGFGPLIVVLVVLASGWYFMRRSLRAKPLRSQACRAEREQLNSEALDEGVEDEVEELPKDPIEALRVLEERHQESD